jgi:Tfp pilus assembly protein PilF
VKRKPDEMGGYYRIARIGAITGQRLDQAEAAMLRYLRHTPRKGEPALANAQWRLGQIYERRGDRARARASYRASLALDPDNGDAKESLAKLGA